MMEIVNEIKSIILDTKRLAKFGLGFVIAGFIITTIGFTMSGLDVEKYRTDSNSGWYRTVKFIHND